MFAARMPGPETSDVAALSRSTIEVRGARYERIVVRTHWIQPGEGMRSVVRRYLRPLCRDGDVAIVSRRPR